MPRREVLQVGYLLASEIDLYPNHTEVETLDAWKGCGFVYLLLAKEGDGAIIVPRKACFLVQHFQQYWRTNWIKVIW